MIVGILMIVLAVWLLFGATDLGSFSSICTFASGASAAIGMLIVAQCVTRG